MAALNKGDVCITREGLVYYIRAEREGQVQASLLVRSRSFDKVVSFDTASLRDRVCVVGSLDSMVCESWIRSICPEVKEDDQKAWAGELKHLQPRNIKPYTVRVTPEGYAIVVIVNTGSALSSASRWLAWPFMDTSLLAPVPSGFGSVLYRTPPTLGLDQVSMRNTLHVGAIAAGMFEYFTNSIVGGDRVFQFGGND